MKRILVRVLFNMIFFHAFVFADNADATIHNLYHTLSEKPNKSINERIHFFSEAFLGSPYVLGPLGEGPHGEIYQKPLYRTEVFDCTTYVATVLALAQSKNLKEFKDTIRKVNYQNGKVSFVTRNHFISTDWNPTNQHNGYIEDITYKFIDKEGKPVALVAETMINKPAWYLKIAETKTDKAEKLKEYSKQVQQEKAVMLYIPLNVIFNEEEANTFIFDQIPDGSIIEIVRPNWQLEKIIGTNLNISHMGFAIRAKEGLVFREASSEYKKVVDIPLVDYLKPLLKSPTIKGIHVERITG